MVVAFYFRLHLAYFPRPVVAIFARPEQFIYIAGIPRRWIMAFFDSNPLGYRKKDMAIPP